jgi:hypothetical protein
MSMHLEIMYIYGRIYQNKSLGGEYEENTYKDLSYRRGDAETLVQFKGGYESETGADAAPGNA